MGLLFPSSPAIHGTAEKPTLSLAGAAAAHGLLFALLLTIVPAQQLIELARPLAVRLIEEMPDTPPPPPPKRKPLPAPLPVLTANTPEPIPAPAAFVVAAQPPPTPVSVPIAAPPASPAEVPVVAARFDADYLDNPKPVYPSASRRLGEQGRVLLRVFVSADGHAAHIEIKTSSGFARLDEAAREAVARWRFVPARRGPQTIAAWVQVPLTFQLEG